MLVYYLKGKECKVSMSIDCNNQNISESIIGKYLQLVL